MAKATAKRLHSAQGGAIGAEGSIANMQAQAKQMSKAVRLWGDNELRRALVKASKEAAQVAVPFIQWHTPVDTGTLRRNIKPIGTRTQAKIKAGTPKRAGLYAWMVHGGHVLRDGSRYAGVPYLREGIEDAFPKIIRKYLEGQEEAARIFNSRTLKQVRKLKKGK